LSTLNILLLCGLVTPAEQKQHDVFDAGEVHAITRSPNDAQFRHAFAHCLAIAEIAKDKAVKSRTDSRPGLPVGEPFQPFGERLVAVRRLVDANLIQVKCNLKITGAQIDYRMLGFIDTYDPSQGDERKRPSSAL
jgi:hypothetical protein